MPVCDFIVAFYSGVAAENDVYDKGRLGFCDRRIQNLFGLFGALTIGQDNNLR